MCVEFIDVLGLASFFGGRSRGDQFAKIERLSLYRNRTSLRSKDNCLPDTIFGWLRPLRSVRLLGMFSNLLVTLDAMKREKKNQEKEIEGWVCIHLAA